MNIGDTVQDRLRHKWKIKEIKIFDGKQRFVCEPIADERVIQGYKIVEVEFPEAELEPFLQ